MARAFSHLGSSLLRLCLLGLCLTLPAPAQGGFERAVVMVRDAAGKVDGARGVVLLDPRPALPAIGNLAQFDFDGTHPELLWATPSRQTGMLRWEYRERPRAGSVWISAPGVAALLPRLLPGDAQRTTLMPEGAIGTAAGDVEFTFFARTVIDGHVISIPGLRGTRIPLPPALYEVWASVGEDVYWQRLRVAPGETATIELEGPSQELRRNAEATVVPASRLDFVLLGRDAERCVLRGDAIGAPLTTFVPATGVVLADRVVPRPPREQAILWPAADAARASGGLQLEITLAGPAAAEHVTRAFVVSRDASDTWRVSGANLGDELGRSGGETALRLPRVQSGDDWLLVVADDHAPFAMPLAEVDSGQPLAIPRGEALDVTCRLPGGDPARDVLLEFVPKHREVATVAVHTDRRGRADFGNVTLPGTVRASDPRFANVELAVDAVPADGVQLGLGPGLLVRGTVLLPDGQPIAGVTVTLRAPHDGLRPRQRSTISGADGSFTFGGLTENDEYVLFATTRRLGRTWSSKVGRFLAGPEPLTLAIHDEDPELGPGDGGR